MSFFFVPVSNKRLRRWGNHQECWTAYRPWVRHSVSLPLSLSLRLFPSVRLLFSGRNRQDQSREWWWQGARLKTIDCKHFGRSARRVWTVSTRCRSTRAVAQPKVDHWRETVADRREVPWRDNFMYGGRRKKERQVRRKWRWWKVRVIEERDVKVTRGRHRSSVLFERVWVTIWGCSWKMAEWKEE